MGKQFRGEIRAQVIEFVNSAGWEKPNQYLEYILTVLLAPKPYLLAFDDLNKDLKSGSN